MTREDTWVVTSPLRHYLFFRYRERLVDRKRTLRTCLLFVPLKTCSIEVYHHSRDFLRFVRLQYCNSNNPTTSPVSYDPSPPPPAGQTPTDLPCTPSGHTGLVTHFHSLVSTPVTSPSGPDDSSLICHPQSMVHVTLRNLLKFDSSLLNQMVNFSQESDHCLV